MKFCAKCGAQMPENAAVCSRCGTPAVEQQYVPMNQPPVGQPGYYYAPAPMPRPYSQSNENGWVPMVFGIIALIAAVFIVIYYAEYSSYRGPDKDLHVIYTIITNLGMNACSIVAIVTGIAKIRNRSKAMPILGLCFGAAAFLAIFISTIATLA